MKAVIKFLLFSFFVISCRDANNKEDNRFITFNLKDLPQLTTVKLSDLGFVDVEYLPLETTEQSLIQRTINVGELLDKIIFNENYFIIKQSNTILKFKNDGSFIAQIGKVGRGPNEFLVCHDVEIDKKGQIYIVDGGRKKFYIYSEKCEFLRTVNIPVYGALEFRLVDGMFLCYNENHLGTVENSFSLIDNSGKIVKRFPNLYPFVKNPKGAYGFSHENLFYRFNDRLFKKEVYSDTIYAYDNMYFKPHMVIEAGDRLITPKERSEMATLGIATNYIAPRNLFEFGNYVYYEFWYKFDFSNSLIYSFIGSKKNNYHVLIDPGQGLINDLDGGPNILPLTIKDDNTIISWVDAPKLKAHVASETFKDSKPQYPEKKKELEKLAYSLNETDNPVLMMVRLKK